MDAVIATGSQDPDHLGERALILNKLGRWDEALAAFEIVLAVDPADQDSLVGKATALRALGDLEESRAILDKVLTSNPNHAHAKIVRQVVFGNSGAVFTEWGYVWILVLWVGQVHSWSASSPLESRQTYGIGLRRRIRWARFASGLDSARSIRLTSSCEISCEMTSQERPIQPDASRGRPPVQSCP
jgi:tetratricopeptide (TPR) repeat protein